MHEVLLLNANAQPLSFLPISCISWQQAIKLLYLDTVVGLHHYDNWEVHSPSITMRVPAVVILRKQVHNVRQWVPRYGIPQKSLVFLRDNFTCQYCQRQFPRGQLTIDHVVPRKYGGRTRWENIVACCHACNSLRGHNMAIQPHTRPFKPSYALLVRNMRKFPLKIAHLSWNYYLGWSDDKLIEINPRIDKVSNENFDLGVRIPLQYS